jgi:hypothetical protein
VPYASFWDAGIDPDSVPELMYLGAELSIRHEHQRVMTCDETYLGITRKK